MHDRRPQIHFGDTARLVVFYPPEATAEAVSGNPYPSSASASVWGAGSTDDDTPEFSPAVTVDSFAGAAVSGGISSANRRQLTMTSTTGAIVGRYYVVKNSYGQREIVRVAAVVSSTVIYVADDLQWDYSAATMSGIRMSFPVDATWVADATNINTPDDPWRVRWTYTINGIVRRRWLLLDLVRAEAEHSVTEAYLFARCPELRFQRPLGDLDWSGIVEAGWRRTRGDLTLDGCDVAAIRDRGLLDELVADAALLAAALAGIVPPGRDPETVVRERTLEYHGRRQRITSSPSVATATNSGAITTSSDDGGWFRS